MNKIDKARMIINKIRRKKLCSFREMCQVISCFIFVTTKGNEVVSSKALFEQSPTGELWIIPEQYEIAREYFEHDKLSKHCKAYLEKKGYL